MRDTGMARTSGAKTTGGVAGKALALAQAARSALGLAFKNIRWSGYGGGAVGSPTASSTRALGRFFGIGTGGQYDYETQAGDLWKNSAVAICLGWVRRNFPEPRLTVQRRKGNEWIDDPEHKILEGLEEPNTGYDDDTLWSATCLSLIVDGNAYWYRQKNGAGRYFYWYIPHWEVEPRWPEDGSKFISHYDHTVDGTTRTLPVESVIHFRLGLDPENQRKGMSDLKACIREVATDNEATTYTAAILRNMGVAGVIITPETDSDEIDDPEELKRLYKAKTTGENRGDPLVYTIPLRTTQIGATPEKMALDKIRMIPEARICAAIGLDPMVVSLSTGKEGRTFSNLGEANRHAYQNCLMPLQKSMAKAIQRQSRDVIEGRRTTRLVWDYGDVQALREDQGELTKRVVLTYQGGLMKLNEGRARLGLAPEAGPAGEEYCKKPSISVVPQVGDNSVKGDAA